MLGRLIRLLLILVVLAGAALIGYAYSGLMQPDTREITAPVDLSGEQ
ncbi:MAG: hypothetical protein AAFN09_03395 [Pseudomonadota bacterium]